MRYIIDTVLIIILLAIGSAIHDYSTKQNVPLVSQMEQFERDVAKDRVIQDIYVNDKPSLRQVEENNAGKLAKQVSNAIIDFVDATTSFTAELLKQSWK